MFLHHLPVHVGLIATEVLVFSNAKVAQYWGEPE